MEAVLFIWVVNIRKKRKFRIGRRGIRGRILKGEIRFAIQISEFLTGKPGIKDYSGFVFA
jgi:hypothetical protein